MTNDQELRLECLRLAEQNASNNTDASVIVSRANEFFQFLYRGDLKQAEVPPHTSEKLQQDCFESQDQVEQSLVVVALTPELRVLLSQLLK